MLDCILIDDEPPALRRLERLLAVHTDQLRIVGRFQRGKEALAEVEALAASQRPGPAVAFIDMQMPGLSGLDIAAALRQHQPAIAIVFITAHRDYAVEAFTTEAIDYLLKPVEPARLAQTIVRLQRHCTQSAVPLVPPVPAAPVVQIRAFGGLTVSGPGGEVRWHSAKTREIFAYQLQHHRTGFMPETLIENVYASSVYAHARQRYSDDLYRLRRRFAEVGIGEDQLRIERHSLQFNPDEVWIDVDHIEGLPESSAKSLDEAELIRGALQIASGAYLQGYNWLWAMARHEQLEALRQRLQSRLADLDLAAGRYDLAEAGLLQLLDLAPYDESAITRLIRLYFDTGKPAQAHRVFMRYRRRLFDDLQLAPSTTLSALFER
jgi:two-component system, LytTR family, response regulator